MNSLNLTVESVHSRLKRVESRTKEHIAKLQSVFNQDDHEKIRGYIEGESRNINKAMWGNFKNSPGLSKTAGTADAILKRDKLAKLKNKARGLAKSLSKAPAPDKDETLYHGWRQAKPPTPGEHPVKGFLSTSMHPAVAGFFADRVEHKGDRHVLRIKTKAGQKSGAYISHVSDDLNKEMEYLVKPGSKLHIHGKPKKLTTKGGRGEPVTFHVWRAEIK